MIDSDSWRTHDEAVIDCRLCPRLVAWREEVARVKRRAFRDWEYWGKPVPGFGDHDARMVIVGLAPGAHGSNRTGRMFTGDASGEFLYAALYRAGFASQPQTTNRNDGMALNDAYITAVCRCAPPDNKPLPVEMAACRPFLLHELEMLEQKRVLVALGRISFDALVAIYEMKESGVQELEFGHGRLYRLPENPAYLLASYHPSRQNTQTGRLTTAMFEEIWQTARRLLNHP